MQIQESMKGGQGCREGRGKVGGGGQYFGYVLLVVPCTSWGVWGHAPRKNCALRQLLVQSEAKICLTVVS